MEMEIGDINRLPEECLSHVISFTTPRDAIVCSAVSRPFQSAANSDATWERFLPSDYASILSRAFEPVQKTPKKDLYFRLCDHPLLIDGGTMSFQLEKSSGAKCFMISARALTIIWGDDDRYWQWIAPPESRFNECAELIDVCWLEIKRIIDINILTVHTAYAAYLVFKLAPNAYGLSRILQKTKITLAGATVSEHLVCVDVRERETPDPYEEMEEITDDVILPKERQDGWWEVELGEFNSGDGTDGEVGMFYLGRDGRWKSGLIVQGIEIRRSTNTARLGANLAC